MKVSILSTAHVHFEAFASAVKQCTGTELAGIYDDDAHRGKRKRLTCRRSSLKISMMRWRYVRRWSSVQRMPSMRSWCLRPLKRINTFSVKSHWPYLLSARSGWRKRPEQDVVLATAFPLRFNTPAMEMKRVIEQKQIGEVLAFHGVNPGNARKAGLLIKSFQAGAH